MRGIPLQISNMKSILLLIQLFFSCFGSISPKGQFSHTSVYGTYLLWRLQVIYRVDIFQRLDTYDSMAAAPSSSSPILLRKTEASPRRHDRIEDQTIGYSSGSCIVFVIPVFISVVISVIICAMLVCHCTVGFVVSEANHGS